MTRPPTSYALLPRKPQHLRPCLAPPRRSKCAPAPHAWTPPSPILHCPSSAVEQWSWLSGGHSHRPQMTPDCNWGPGSGCRSGCSWAGCSWAGRSWGWHCTCTWGTAAGQAPHVLNCAPRDQCCWVHADTMCRAKKASGAGLRHEAGFLLVQQAVRAGGWSRAQHGSCVPLCMPMHMPSL